MGQSSCEQVAILSIQLQWTTDSEDALHRAVQDEDILAATNEKNHQRLAKLVTIIASSDTLQGHAKWLRKKFEGLILIDVHQRDVFAGLVLSHVCDPEE